MDRNYEIIELPKENWKGVPCIRSIGRKRKRTIWDTSLTEKNRDGKSKF